MRQFSFCLILIISLSECAKLKESEGKSTSSDIAFADSASIDVKTKQLVETVLNLPSMLKFSKVDLIQKKYDAISIYFNQDTIGDNIIPISQKGRKLELLHRIDSTTSDKEPCYVFREITINNNDAYVFVVFDITGGIAFGNLKYIDGSWVPDEEFVVGVR